MGINNKNHIKIENIEFLRIFLIIGIMLHHFASFINIQCMHILPVFTSQEIIHFRTVTMNCLHYCDFFFIISGFFLFYKHYAMSFLDFMKKKIIRYYPLIPVVVLIYFIYSKFHFVNNTFYYNLTTLFLINNVGITSTLGSNGHLWYVSALFWSSLLYIYIVKSYARKNVNLIFALMIFFCYAFLFYADSTHLGHNVLSINYIFNPGIMRALGGIGIGYFISLWYKNYQNRKTINTKKHIIVKLFFTIVEIYLLGFIVRYTMFKVNTEITPILLILYFSLLFIVFLFQKGYVSLLLNKIKFSFVSKYVYSIYVMHMSWFVLYYYMCIRYFNTVFPSHLFCFTIVYIISSFMVGIIFYYFVEQPIRTILKNMLFKEGAII